MSKMSRPIRFEISRRTWFSSLGWAYFASSASQARAAAESSTHLTTSEKRNALLELRLLVPPEDPRSVWITDLSQCQPNSAFSRKRRKGLWQLVDYEAKLGREQIKGSMLMTGPETQPNPLRVPLNAKGWHAVYLGVKTYLGIGESNVLKFKLSSDPCYLQMGVETIRGGVTGEDVGLSDDQRVQQVRLRRRQIQDSFFAFADLTGQSLDVSAVVGGLPEQGVLAYVRLAPLAEADVDALQTLWKTRERRLICLNDNLTFMHVRKPTTREEIWEEIYPYKNTAYKAIYWTAVRGDNCLYPTRVGTVMGAEGDDFPRVGDRFIAESMRTLIEKKIDPVQTALELTRSLGMEFHLGVRVEAFTAEPPWDGIFRSKFFYQHPELWCVDYDGRPIARLSYAFEESQQHMLDLIRELGGYNPDGIMLIFTRAQPYVLYEKPVAEAFQKRYGLRVQDVEERDERLLRLRAELVTGFLKKVRQALNDLGRGRPKPIELSVMVLANETANRFHALDPAAWVKEGIIDMLSPSQFSIIRSEAPIDMNYFAEMVRNTSCRLTPTLRPSWLTPGETIALARESYAAGATDLIIFDVNLHHRFPTEWKLWRHLGHPGSLADLKRSDKLGMDLIEMTRVNGLVVDQYPPLWAF